MIHDPVKFDHENSTQPFALSDTGIDVIAGPINISIQQIFMK